MAGQLLIRNPRVQRAADGKGWVVLHPSNDAILGTYDNEWHAQEVARSLSTLGWPSGGVQPWRVSVRNDNDATDAATVIVWARGEASAGEVAARVAAKRGSTYRDSHDYSVTSIVRLTGEIPENARPEPIGIDVWVRCEGCQNHPDYPHLQRDRWRTVAEIGRDLKERIDASDLSYEYHGIDISIRYGDNDRATIPGMLPGKLWRIVVAAVVGSNEGHYIHVWAMGHGGGNTLSAVGLYTVKTLSGEDEADTIAACLRAWVQEG